MSELIDRLCDQLRIKLHGIDRRLEALKANGSDMSDKSRYQIESQIDAVQQRIYDRRRAVEAANTRVTAWTEGKRSSFDVNVADWKEHRRQLELNSRADDSEPTRLPSSSSQSRRLTKRPKRRSKHYLRAVIRRRLRCLLASPEVDTILRGRAREVGERAHKHANGRCAGPAWTGPSASSRMRRRSRQWSPPAGQEADEVR